MKKYFFITLKRQIEELIMAPFVWAGKAIARFKPLKEEYDIFMFFPIYGIGGAEKVNGSVVAALPDKKIIIFFTRKSPEDTLLHLFTKPNVTIRDVSRWTDNKFIYWANLAYRGICAQYIHAQKKEPVVFNGQCNFAYKLFPHLHKNILKVELSHNSTPDFAKIVHPYVPFIDTRVMITETNKRNFMALYRKVGIPAEYDQRIVKINNCVYVPEQYTPKRPHNPLRIYYVGRSGYHKHLELLYEIIRRCFVEAMKIEVHLAGTFEDEIPADIRPKIVWHGMISSDEDMYALHRDMDVLVMTSRTEGFPIAMMEAMACGVPIVTTSVGGIPEHLTNGKNGFLIPKNEDQQVVNDMIAALQKLASDPQLYDAMSRNNYAYAKENFSPEVFARAYRKVFGFEA